MTIRVTVTIGKTIGKPMVRWFKTIGFHLADSQVLPGNGATPVLAMPVHQPLELAEPPDGVGGVADGPVVAVGVRVELVVGVHFSRQWS